MGLGENSLIGGFIIGGTETKKVIIRGIGPSLGLSGALADPIIEIHDDSGQTIATNDNWQDGDVESIRASKIPPTQPLESAVVLSLDPGSYTAVLRGVNEATGIGLIEVYDLEPAALSRLANVSTRGNVQTGDKAMIGGMIILGDAPAKVLFRAIGTSLPFPDALQDPTLELYDKDGALVASNDDWRSDQEGGIIATGAPPTKDAESAIVITLSPGAYTAVVRGANDTVGLALIEAYQIDK